MYCIDREPLIAVRCTCSMIVLNNIFLVGLDFVLTEEQRRDMTLEEQLKDLQEKLDMTQAIKHGGQICDMLLQCLLPGDSRNLCANKRILAGNSLIYVIAHDLVVRRMGNAILLKNPNPVDSALFCWLVLSAIWTNGPKAVTSRRSAYVSGSPVLLCVYESF